MPEERRRDRCLHVITLLPYPRTDSLFNMCADQVLIDYQKRRAVWNQI